jgi:hypothetical protein
MKYNTLSADRKIPLLKLIILSVLFHVIFVLSICAEVYVLPALVGIGLLTVFVMCSFERSIYLIPLFVIFSYSVPFLKIGDRILNIGFDYVFLAVLIGVWLMRKAVSSSMPIREKIDFKKPLIIFTIFQAISAIKALLTSGYIDAVLFLIIWTEYLFIFFILVDMDLPISKTKHLLYIMLIIANAVASYGIVDYLFTGGIRITSVFSGIKGSPNVLGIYLVIFTLFSICFALYFKKLLKVLMIASALLLSIALVFTLSRSSWVALVAGVFLIGVLERKSLILWVFLASFFIVLFFPEIIVHRAESIIKVVSNPKIINFFSNINYNLGRNEPAIASLLVKSGFNVDVIGGAMRYVTWTEALNIFKQFPILGSGIFMILHFGRVGTTDCLYLEILSGMGILGSMVFVWFGVKLTQYSITTYRRVENSFNHYFVLGYLATILALGVVSITGNVALSPKLLGVFWLLTATLVNIRESNQQKTIH